MHHYNLSYKSPSHVLSRAILGRLSSLIFLIMLSVLPMVAPLPLSAQTASPQVPDFLTNPSDFASEMLRREAQLVYLVNVERVKAGLPPVRWNRELSEAARWFAYDSVETRINCGNMDSKGHYPGTRLRYFGFTQIERWGENIACGFTEPSAAVSAWMNSPTQRSIILDPLFREAGAGYYYSVTKGRGYVVLDLSVDSTFAPMIINSEAVSTTAPAVELYIHPQLGQPTSMKVSNSPTFTGANWEPIAVRKNWNLEPGEGWRTVYVLVRDALGRTSQLTDMIYLGGTVPEGQVGLQQATNIGQGIALTHIAEAAGNPIRLSAGWLLDNSDPSFEVYRGASTKVQDASAVGGDAAMFLGDFREGMARLATIALPTQRMLTAYFRFKVAENAGNQEVARVIIKAENRQFGPLSITASDFVQANSWQDFGLDIAFNRETSAALVEIEIYRTGEADVAFDTVRFFGQPLPTGGTVYWDAGNENLRSRGMWARFETPAGAGEVFDLAYAPVDNVAQLAGAPELDAYPNGLNFTSVGGSVEPLNEAVVVCGVWCNQLQWQAVASVPWLNVISSREGVLIQPNPSGLAKGVYYGNVFINPVAQVTSAGEQVAPTSVSVELRVDGATALEPRLLPIHVYLPYAARP